MEFGRNGRVVQPVKSKVVEVMADKYPIDDYTLILAGELVYVAKILEIRKEYNSDAGESELSKHFIARKLLTEAMGKRNRIAYLKRVFRGDAQCVGMYLRAFELYEESMK